MTITTPEISAFSIDQAVHGVILVISIFIFTFLIVNKLYWVIGLESMLGLFGLMYLKSKNKLFIFLGIPSAILFTYYLSLF